MSKLEIKPGDKINYLTVIEKDLDKMEKTKKKHGSGHTYWKCKCICGRIISPQSDALNKGQKSCGCMAYIERHKSNANLTLQSQENINVLNTKGKGNKEMKIKFIDKNVKSFDEMIKNKNKYGVVFE